MFLLLRSGHFWAHIFDKVLGQVVFCCCIFRGRMETVIEDIRVVQSSHFVILRHYRFFELNFVRLLFVIHTTSLGCGMFRRHVLGFLDDCQGSLSAAHYLLVSHEQQIGNCATRVCLLLFSRILGSGWQLNLLLRSDYFLKTCSFHL